MRALEQLLEILVPDDQRDGQANRAPQGIAAANPVPELEHVSLVDTKGSHRLRVRAQSDEVLRDRRLVLRGIEEPRACTLRVRDRLLRRERLARNDEQCRLGIAQAQRLRNVRPVDVRHEVRREIALRVRAQRLRDHHRAQVRPADANVDDRLDRLARVPLPRAAAYVIGERLDVREYTRHLAHAGLRDFESRQSCAAQRVAPRGPQRC